MFNSPNPSQDMSMFLMLWTENFSKADNCVSWCGPAQFLSFIVVVMLSGIR